MNEGEYKQKLIPSDISQSRIESIQAVFEDSKRGRGQETDKSGNSLIITIPAG